jgi:DNA polymerase-3 subunit gamma/tau
MGSAAPALEELSPEPIGTEATGVSSVPPVDRAISVNRSERGKEATVEALRDAVLNALGDQPMLISILETAEWHLNGNALTAKVAASATMIEMSFPADARRIASAAASGLAGRPIKMLVEYGGTPQASPAPRTSSLKSGGSARSRAEQDPIVQRMREKFGAEIRTVIDYREKG